MAESARFARDHLKSFVERIERLAEEKSAIADDIKSVYAEAKANGFDTRAIRTVIKLRKMDVDERKENEAILDTYLHRSGWPMTTPLQSAVTAMSFDRAVRDQVVDAFKEIVPATGEVIIKMGGAPLRLYRDSKGKPKVEEITVAEADEVRPGKKLGSRKKSADILTLVPKGEGEKAPVVPADEKEPEPVE